MVGLTQAEVAHRAGLTQQTVAGYERGRREPSVATLNQLLSGCGVRLGWRLIPEPGLVDEPTRYLLSKPPLDRLDPGLAKMLTRPPAADPSFPLLIGGKVATRLHGAVVLAYEIDSPAHRIGCIRCDRQRRGSRLPRSLPSGVWQRRSM
jgi:transcriptional regulator with XRE-family HTH domain